MFGKRTKIALLFGKRTTQDQENVSTVLKTALSVMGKSMGKIKAQKKFRKIAHAVARRSWDRIIMKKPWWMPFFIYRRWFNWILKSK